MRRVAYIAILVVATASYCQAQREVKFTALQVVIGNEVAEPSTRVIRTANEWDEFLKENAASLRGRASVDFGKQMAAAVFAGQKSTGGYSLQVTRVVDQSEPGQPARGVVHYRLVSPSPDDLVTQALTYPHVVIRIEKRFDQLEFSPAK